LSDLIKFARYTPKEQEAMKLFADARQLVQATQIAETQQEKLPV
jgi:hypothetical protein